MGSLVVHIIHNVELFKASIPLIGVVHIIHRLELFIAFGALSIRLRIAHVINNPRLFIVFRPLGQ